MKVLAIAFVYNELPFIETAINYYKAQGCELYVIDNMSDDGTWEWLQENNIQSHRFDTDNGFQLEWLQAEMVKTIHKIKPDWFLWFAPDLFHVFDKTIKDTIQEVEGLQYNQIASYCYCVKNTGEYYDTPLFFNYRYAYKNPHTLLCSQYSEQLKIFADRITIPNTSSTYRGVILEYGGCKPREYQEAKLKRRKKAWKQGTPEGHGTHYLQGEKQNWVYDKIGLIDTWTNDDTINYVRKLQNDDK